MPAAALTRRRYDHRIRDAILDGQYLADLQTLAIPSSTVRSWVRRGAAPVVVLDPSDANAATLENRLAHLERRLACLLALVRLLVVFVRTMGSSLDEVRVPTGATKTRILDAVDRATTVLGRRAALRIVGLTDARLRVWRKRELACALDDAAPCPRTFPSRLTREERNTVRDLVEDDRYKHVPIRSLALLGKRLGRVYASYATWRSLIHEYGWRRPRVRLYPPKPSIGVRATAPNEWWHLDVTIIRLLDGTKVYLHGVIDNYSRKILAWTVEPVLRAQGTRAILLEAKAKLGADAKVKVMTDGGSENFIIGKDTDLVTVAEHVVAQAAIHFSNSMIEAFWKQLKYQWLYLHQLDTIATLRRLVAAYVTDHNVTHQRHRDDLRPRAHQPAELHGGGGWRNIGRSQTSATLVHALPRSARRAGTSEPGRARMASTAVLSTRGA